MHVFTDDSSSQAKAAQYSAPRTTEFPKSASQDWYGTGAEPGKQIVFDLDSDRANNTGFNNILVGEPVRGAT